MSKVKQLFKDGFVYGIGGIAAKSIGIFLIPVYTRIFPPAEYGKIEMLSTISFFIGAFMVLGLDSAQSFFFFEQKNKGTNAQAQVVTSILKFRLTWGCFVIIVGSLLSPLLNLWLFNGEIYWYYFLIAFSSLFFQQVMVQSAEIFRLLYKPWYFISITLAYTICSAALVLFFVKIIDLGILSFFLGSLISGLVLCLAGWYRARMYLTKVNARKEWWPRILKFGLPMLPAGLAYYGMSTADRWIIQFYKGPIELGIYSVAAKFGLIMAFCVDTFRQAVWPIAMESINSDDGEDIFKIIARLYLGVGVVLVNYLTFLSPWIIKLFSAPAYHEAYKILGIMGWQALFYGFYLIVSVGIWKREKTYLSAWLVTGSAVLNVILNVLLVPPFGSIGAAVATAISYLVWIVITYLISEKLWPIKLPLGRYFILISAGVLMQIALLMLQDSGNMIMAVVSIHLFIVGIFFFLVPKSTLAKLKEVKKQRITP